LIGPRARALQPARGGSGGVPVAGTSVRAAFIVIARKA
jgi:hypothetical protein